MTTEALLSDPLVTRPEAARALRLSTQTLAVWSMSGRYLPVIKCGRAVRYRVSDIERLIEQQTIPASSEGQQ